MEINVTFESSNDDFNINFNENSFPYYLLDVKVKDITGTYSVVVDKIATIDISGYAKLTDVADAIEKAHSHSNKSLLDTITSDNLVTLLEKQTWDSKSVVTVSSTGTSTTEIEYLTLNGNEYKLGGAGIDDTVTSATKTWSSSKINTELGNKVDKVSSVSKVYGTDASGNQTTYDLGSLGTTGAVKYNEAQTLTDNEKIQARSNIGASGIFTYTILGESD